MNRRDFVKLLVAVPFIRTAKVVAGTQVDELQLCRDRVTHVHSDPASRYGYSINGTRVLHCIAQRETNNNPAAIGLHGERSAYQMKKSVWVAYCTLPFHYATRYPRLAFEVAAQHLNTIRNDLWRSTGDKNDVYRMALAWHYGVEGAKRHGSSDEYALAVQRLFLS